MADDTSRPSLPDQVSLPIDSSFTVEAPDLTRAEALYHRNIVGIIFDDTTSGTTIRGLINRYAGTIIGGSPGDREYIVRIPDPGPTFAALDSVVTRLYAEPGVAIARKVYYRTPIYIHGTNTEVRVAAQTSGRVVDVVYRVPVHGAVVQIRGTPFVAETDSGGRFGIPGRLTVGCHALQVRAVGYSWTEVRFTTTSNTAATELGDVPLRFGPIPEWPLLLVYGCDSGPLASDEAPWGVDTLRPR